MKQYPSNSSVAPARRTILTRKRALWLEWSMPDADSRLEAASAL